MSKSDLIDITVTKLAETGLAILVTDGDKDDAVWLPKSQIEIQAVNAFAGTLLITLPEWLAIDKGLV